MDLTLLLIIVTTGISLLAWQNPRWLNALIYHGPSVTSGQWWRMLTHGFIHADGTHLLFNMITLFFFGRFVESLLAPRIGLAGFALFYLAAIVFAVIPSHLRHWRDPSYRSLGASGAVSAVLFGFILVRPWSMLYVMFVPIPAIVFAALYVTYSVWADRRGGDNINHMAHLWGAAWGTGFLLVLEPRLLPHFLGELTRLPF